MYVCILYDNAYIQVTRYKFGAVFTKKEMNNE